MCPVRTAVIGAGAMGRHHARNYAALPQAELAAIVDPDIGRAQQVARDHGCQAYASVGQLLAHEPALAAASVVTPVSTHAHVSRELLEAGCNVLVEKPIASTLKEAAELVSVARGSARVLAVGHIERFNPAVWALRRLIEAGDLGTPLSALARRVGVMPARVPDTDVVLDLAIHDLDVLRYLIGDVPIRILHCALGSVNGGPQIDLADILLDAGGVSCFVQSNWVTPVKIRSLAVTGTAGYAEVDYSRRELRFHRALRSTDAHTFAQVLAYSEHEPILLPVERAEPLAIELTEFLEAVRGEGGRIVTPDDATASLALALTARSIGDDSKTRAMVA